MLPLPPTPNAAVLKRLQQLPLDYWRQVNDALADLLCTLFPHAEDSRSLLTIVRHEAGQGHGLCQQFLEQGRHEASAWLDPRHQASLAAWQAVCQTQPGALQLAWRLGVVPLLLAQGGWLNAWQRDAEAAQEVLHLGEQLLLANAQADDPRLARLRLQLARLDLSVVDHATWLVLLSEELPRSLTGLGQPLDGSARDGLRWWVLGLGQRLCVPAPLLAKNADESCALRPLLAPALGAGAGRAVRQWLQQLAMQDPLPAAERRLLALARALRTAPEAQALALPADALGKLWRRTQGWLLQTQLGSTRANTAFR